VDVDISEWGTVYNSNLLRIQASPDKQQILITVKQQNALDDHTHKDLKGTKSVGGGV